MEGSWYPWYSDGTRNPLFPWLATAFLDANDPAFFEKGKKLNVVFAICGTAAVGVFFSRRLGPLASFNATVLASLAALLPISTFFGAEAIFLVLFLFVCACGMRLLNENRCAFTRSWCPSCAGWLAKSSTTLPGIVYRLQLRSLALSLAFKQNLPGISARPAERCRFGVDSPLRRGLLCPHLSPAPSRTKGMGKPILQPAKFLVLGGRLGNLCEQVRRLQEASPGGASHRGTTDDDRLLSSSRHQ